MPAQLLQASSFPGLMAVGRYPEINLSNKKSLIIVLVVTLKNNFFRGRGHSFLTRIVKKGSRKGELV